MTIKEMIEIKKINGYSNQYIADKAGLPLGTVQKIFSGNTTSPRHQTLQALNKLFSELEAEQQDKTKTDKKVYYRTDESQYANQLLMEKRSYGQTTTAEKIIGNETTGTIDDYIALPEGTRVELIDGVFYDMAAPTFIHQRISAMIFNQFENFVNENGSDCIPSIAPTDVQLDCDDKTMVQPDVLIICDRKKIIKPRVVGAPDLIVEVLSPSNWYMDIIKKKDKYKNAGVREYWIVLPEQKKVLAYNFEKSGEYVEYSFEDKIPVAIWDNKCEVDFAFIYEKISFLYD